MGNCLHPSKINHNNADDRLDFSDINHKKTTAEACEERSKRVRIRVVITKEELQQLISKNLSIEDCLVRGIHSNARIVDQSTASTWKPALETIPEYHF